MLCEEAMAGVLVCISLSFVPGKVIFRPASRTDTSGVGNTKLPAMTGASTARTALEVVSLGEEKKFCRTEIMDSGTAFCLAAIVACA